MTSRRRIIVLIVAVVAIALVVVASVLMSQDQDQSDSSAATTPTTPAKTSEYGFPISHIRLGEGGTKTAPDGKTPIGYTASCEDAVRAAVNYVAADSYSPENWKNQKATLQQITASGEYNTKYINATASLVSNNSASAESSLISPAIYKVENCESGKSADIVVALQIVDPGLILDGKTIAPSVEFRTQNQALVWEDNDWKIDFSPTPVRAESQLIIAEGEKTPDSPNDLLNQIFVDSQGNPLSRDGWTELAE
ncbi:hypothetical protein [Glutamicibacter sp. NPDC087673]|uniref:hypothetical protein n=1 Tax=Glutamicibacter sp. NPDC087673 TaxID=3363997 RepID=UPI0037FDA3E2